MNRVLSSKLYQAMKEVKITKIHSLPVLNHVKMEFVYGELRLTSTDLEETFTAKVPCILEEEWETCVPAVSKIDVSNTHRPRWNKVYPFMDFLKVCAEYDDVLEFTFDPKVQIMKIKVQGERSVTEFKCIDAQEFPPSL